MNEETKTFNKIKKITQIKILIKFMKTPLVDQDLNKKKHQIHKNHKNQNCPMQKSKSKLIKKSKKKEIKKK